MSECLHPIRRKEQMIALNNNVKKKWQMPNDDQLKQMIIESIIRNDGQRGGVKLRTIKEINPETLQKLDAATFISFCINDKTYAHSFDDKNLKEKVDDVFAIFMVNAKTKEWKVFVNKIKCKSLKECNSCQRYFVSKSNNNGGKQWWYLCKNGAKCLCKCGSRYYCNYKCQKKDWSQNKHRIECAANKEVIYFLSLIINGLGFKIPCYDMKCNFKIFVCINKLCDFNKCIISKLI